MLEEQAEISKETEELSELNLKITNLEKQVNDLTAINTEK